MFYFFLLNFYRYVTNRHRVSLCISSRFFIQAISSTTEHAAKIPFESGLLLFFVLFSYISRTQLKCDNNQKIDTLITECSHSIYMAVLAMVFFLFLLLLLLLLLSLRTFIFFVFTSKYFVNI